MLIVVGNLSTSTYPQEVSFDYPYQTNKETVDSCNTSYGKHPLKPDTEDFLKCLSSNLPSTQNPNHPQEENLHGMMEEDVNLCPTKETDQENQDYIEWWFQEIITSKHHYLVQQLLVSYHSKLLVFHVFVYIKVYISNLSMDVFLHLLCTWLN